MKITLTLPPYLVHWLAGSDFPDSSDISGNALASLMTQYIESKAYPAAEGKSADIDQIDLDPISGGAGDSTES